MMSLALLKVDPPLSTVWMVAAGFAGLGFWAARRWVWPGIVVLAQILISLWGVHDAVTDPVNGPRLLREAGQGYVTQSYVAHAISIAATVVGAGVGDRALAAAGGWVERMNGTRCGAGELRGYDVVI